MTKFCEHSARRECLRSLVRAERFKVRAFTGEQGMNFVFLKDVYWKFQTIDLI